jgi:RNA polymerase sigma factor (TIGR02999 family)
MARKATSSFVSFIRELNPVALAMCEKAIACLDINHWQQQASCFILQKSAMSNITLVLESVGRGESKATEELFPLVYEELRRLAAARMAREAAGHTLQPTALVHEAWLQLVGEGGRTWKNRAHFFGAAADAMRRILIDNARRKSALKHGGGQERVALENLEITAGTLDEHILMIDEALQRLEAEDPQKARIVSLKFFGGLNNEETAENLGISLSTVKRQWILARIKLFRLIQEQNG